MLTYKAIVSIVTLLKDLETCQIRDKSESTSLPHVYTLNN